MQCTAKKKYLLLSKGNFTIVVVAFYNSGEYRVVNRVGMCGGTRGLITRYETARLENKISSRVPMRWCISQRKLYSGII